MVWLFKVANQLNTVIFSVAVVRIFVICCVFAFVWLQGVLMKYVYCSRYFASVNPFAMLSVPSQMPGLSNRALWRVIVAYAQASPLQLLLSVLGITVAFHWGSSLQLIWSLSLAHCHDSACCCIMHFFFVWPYSCINEQNHFQCKSEVKHFTCSYLNSNRCTLLFKNLESVRFFLFEFFLIWRVHLFELNRA